MFRNGWPVSISALIAGAMLAFHSGAEAKSNVRILHAFAGGDNDGAQPMAGLAMDKAGNLYGTTQSGGPENGGTVFVLSADGTFSIVHAFTGDQDGGAPVAGLTIANGEFFGATSLGGVVPGRISAHVPGGNGGGVAFKGPLIPNLNLKPMYTYGLLPDADFQIGPFNIKISTQRSAKGGKLTLYATTQLGGDSNAGTIVRATAKGQHTVLYSFSGGNDGAYPAAGLIADARNNLYGTTGSGGNTTCSGGCGVVFKYSAHGKYSVLHSFDGSDGAHPYGDLVADESGNIYGVTFNGGAHAAGTVFKIAASGKHSVLYSFAGGSDGTSPYAGLAIDKKGNLYGTTDFGGDGGKGTVFKLTPDGKETVLHAFLGGNNDGAYPRSVLVIDKKGNLYGTTQNGGPTDNGTVFEVTK